MAERSLYTSHPTALTVLYSDLESHVAGHNTVPTGTPGSLLVRENAGGFRFYSRQYYDATGKKREQYLAGPVGDPEAERVAQGVRDEIAQAKSLVGEMRLLGRSGYQLANARTFSTLAVLHNRGVFRAGGVLVGSHAFGVLLNQLGARAATYATEDVDLACADSLAFDEPPQLSLLEMLRQSGISFVEVPALDHRAPSTRWKEQGRSRFHVDLLVPSPDETFPIIAVPELNAHAQGLPYLRYLVSRTQSAALLAREGCCGVRVPAPERFALHKLLVSQLRTERSAKNQKDVLQASVILAVLSDHHPGAIEEAVDDLPLSARSHVRAGAALAMRLLAHSHPRAAEELGDTLEISSD